MIQLSPGPASGIHQNGFPFHISYILHVQISCYHAICWVSNPSPSNFIAAAAAKSPQSCPTLCDPRDGSPPVLLPGKSHGQRSLVGCSPWGREESDTTELLTLLLLYFKQRLFFSLYSWLAKRERRSSNTRILGF